MTIAFRSLSACALAWVSAFALSACGGGGDSPAPVSGNVSTPNSTATAALGTPVLSFVSPQESLDLNNYTLVGKYTLPVALGAGVNQLAAEVSAVTYNLATDSLFIVGDEGTYITQISKRGELIDTMSLPAGLFVDPEGITAVGGGKFVVTDERVRTANLLTYAGGTTLNAATVQSVKLGTTVGNIGLEGVSFDPATGGYIFVKELSPSGIFQTSIDFAAGTASNGSATTTNSVNLFDPALAGVIDFGDVAALSNVLPPAAPDYQHLMVLSNDTGRILKMDRAGKIYSSLDILQTAAHEGITFDRQLNMYITNEAGGGSQALPQLWVYTPTRTANAVGLRSNLYLTFAADVATGTGNLQIVGSGGDSRSIPVADTAQVSISGATLRINPTADLLPGQTYSVQYASGVVVAAADRVATTAVSSAAALAFSTVQDITEPTLLSSTPSDNAGAVTVTASITLVFDEAVAVGTGTFTLSNGAGDVRVISASDISQVTISGSTVTINPTVDLGLGAAYHVLVSSSALRDAAGNRFAGFTDVTRLNFNTAAATPATVPMLLITEVNSSASGGDFFEIYNYGTTAVDLAGWKWNDQQATFSGSAVAFPAASLPAGGRLVVVNTVDEAGFRAAWGLAATVPVVATGGPGLGQGDAVVLFDTTGKVIAYFSYRAATAAALVASDTTPIVAAAASPGVTTNLGVHAGPSFGAAATATGTSVVWDGVSTSAPAYKAAVAGVLGGFAQASTATAIGSPGQ